MPNCLKKRVILHLIIIRLYNYLQIIFITYFTENLAVFPHLLLFHCIVLKCPHAFSILRIICFLLFFFPRFLGIKFTFDLSYIYPY